MSMTFEIEIDREDDGRWVAEVPGLSGVLSYGRTRDEAVARVPALAALALRVIAERLEHAEAPAELLVVTFHVARAAGRHQGPSRDRCPVQDRIMALSG
jgi:predicted RNase H-like HicB family nuclease